MVSHYIFLRFFFVIITKTRISMMSLRVHESRDWLTWVPKVLAWIHLGLWLIISWGKKKQSLSQQKPVQQIKAKVSCPSLSHYFFWLWTVFLGGNFFHFAIYVSFGNEFVEAYIFRSSLTVMLLCSHGFCLCYRVILDLTQVSISTRLSVTHAEIKKNLTAMFVFNFWNTAA